MKFSPDKRPRPRTVAQAEDEAWVGFYVAVEDPTVAAELIQHIDASEELRKTHAALYLMAKRSIQRAKARDVRNQRIGAFVRAVVGAVFNIPWMFGRRAANEAMDIAVECLPPMKVAVPAQPVEPAVKRVRKLATDKPAIATQATIFAAEAAQGSSGNTTKAA